MLVLAEMLPSDAVSGQKADRASAIAERDAALARIRRTRGWTIAGTDGADRRRRWSRVRGPLPGTRSDTSGAVAAPPRRRWCDGAAAAARRERPWPEDASARRSAVAWGSGGSTWRRARHPDPGLGGLRRPAPPRRRRPAAPATSPALRRRAALRAERPGPRRSAPPGGRSAPAAPAPSGWPRSPAAPDDRPMAESYARFPALGSTAVVGVTDPLRPGGRGAAVEETVAEFDLACSRFRSDSELTAVNEAAGARRARWVRCCSRRSRRRCGRPCSPRATSTRRWARR